MDHYYTSQPQSAHKPGEVRFTYRLSSVVLATDSGVFSRTELDRGTEVLLNALPQTLTGSLLDMGCGYGVIGIAAGKTWPELEITMSDVNERACGLARDNAAQNRVKAEVLCGDAYATVQGRRFDTILQNPPIRAGKAVIYKMFADAAACLTEGGSLWLVIRKQQGAPSALNYLKTLFATVEIPEKESGYWIFRCTDPLKQEKEG